MKCRGDVIYLTEIGTFIARRITCPYGAMEVVVRPVIRNSGAGLNVRADKAEANKCDLCNHREDGPACMAACPTHALICVDRNKLEQLSAEKRRRTALMF